MRFRDVVLCAAGGDMCFPITVMSTMLYA